MQHIPHTLSQFPITMKSNSFEKVLKELPYTGQSYRLMRGVEKS